jgi:hypothetical protein
MDFHINVFLSKKLAQFLKYFTHKTVKNGYSVKLVLFDLNTLMKIIQIFMSFKNVWYIII